MSTDSLETVLKLRQREQDDALSVLKQARETTQSLETEIATLERKLSPGAQSDVTTAGELAESAAQNERLRERLRHTRQRYEHASESEHAAKEAYDRATGRTRAIERTLQQRAAQARVEGSRRDTAAIDEMSVQRHKGEE